MNDLCSSELDAPAPTTRKKEGPPVSPLRIIVAGLMLIFGVCFMAFAMNGAKRANTDYICYWSAGRQLVHHLNPYDKNGILQN